jgi:hypothetical protein
MLCYVMLCHVMVPLQHTRQRAVGVGGGGLHGIRSVGGGAQLSSVRSSNPALFEDGVTACVLDG